MELLLETPIAWGNPQRYLFLFFSPPFLVIFVGGGMGNKLYDSYTVVVDYFCGLIMPKFPLEPLEDS